MAGRTVTRWVRFVMDDISATPREIPINSLSPVGFVYEEVESSAWQDSLIGYLRGHPTATIEIGGPWSEKTAVGLAASTAKPTLTGSNTLLHPLISTTFTAPLGLAVMLGENGYWATGDPVFGVVSPSTVSGYVLTSYIVDGDSYTARFQPWPGTTPAWGTAALS